MWCLFVVNGEFDCIVSEADVGPADEFAAEWGSSYQVSFRLYATEVEARAAALHLEWENNDDGRSYS